MEQRLAELHIIRAREKGLRLHMASDAVIPGEWKNVSTELISMEAFEFAFHARRINQLCGFIKDDWPPINVFNHRISAGDPENWESSYKRALDRLVHTEQFALGYSHMDHRQIFTASESNLTAMYLAVKTDFKELASISIFGITYCFLNHVIGKIKHDFPHLTF